MMWTLLGLSSLLYGARANCDDYDAVNLCRRDWTVVQTFPSMLLLEGINTWNGLFQSNLKYRIELGNAGLQVDVDYVFRSGIQDPKLSYTYRMPALLEFYSPDDSAFDPQDEVQQIYDLGNVTWSAWDLQNTTIRDGVLLYSFTSTTSDGVFTIRGRTTSEVVYNFPAAGDTSSPNFIKFDYIMNNFSYSERADTSLAMVACVGSELSSGISLEHNQITINPETSSYIDGALLWDIFVSTQPNNHTDDVVATYGAAETVNLCLLGEETVYYSVTTNQRLDSFVWDPFTGVLALPATPTFAPLPPKSGAGTDVAIAIVVIVLALLLFFWWRRQHNKSEYGQMGEAADADPMATY